MKDFFKFGPGWGDNSDDSTSNPSSSFGGLFSFREDNNDPPQPSFKFPGANEEDPQNDPPRPSFSVWSEPAEDQLPTFQKEVPEPGVCRPSFPKLSTPKPQEIQKISAPKPMQLSVENPGASKAPSNFSLPETQPRPFVFKPPHTLTSNQYAEKLCTKRNNNPPVIQQYESLNRTTKPILDKIPTRKPPVRIIPKSPAFWRPPSQTQAGDNQRPEFNKFQTPQRRPSARAMPHPMMQQITPLPSPPTNSTEGTEKQLSIVGPKDDPFFDEYQEYLNHKGDWVEQSEMQGLLDIENATTEIIQELSHRFDDNIALAKDDLAEAIEVRKKVLLSNAKTFGILPAEILEGMDTSSLAIKEACCFRGKDLDSSPALKPACVLDEID